MTTIDSLAAEFGHEAATTRKHLERLPDDALDWRPHPKSFTARGLASHIVECVRWTEAIFSKDELDLNPAEMRPFQAASVAALLDAFDRSVAAGRQILAETPEAKTMEPWRLKLMGRVRFERPRAIVFRDFTLNHLVHHRGQFTVYLRLLDVPVPGSYGPTADEQI